jgi:thiopeptide-type bacteriocin biosynthesis protein
MFAPGASDAQWLSAKLFTHPERIAEIVTEHLPGLLSSLNNPECWWLRYHSPNETDHLRLRIATAPGDYGRYADVVGEWAQQMRNKRLHRRLVLDTYAPETGRYGHGPSLQAAETVFAADSSLVAKVLLLQPVMEVDFGLVVANMVGIVNGLLRRILRGDGLAGEQPTSDAPALERAVTERAIRIASDPTQIPGWETGIEAAWRQRAEALAVYRKTLPPETNVAAVLESLMHMHHNRAVGINPKGERTCRRLVRQAARSQIARSRTGVR